MASPDTGLESAAPPKKEEESAGTKTAQAPKPENKPVGSANVVTAYDFEATDFEAYPPWQPLWQPRHLCPYPVHHLLFCRLHVSYSPYDILDLKLDLQLATNH
jgi:hypothetical protein